MTESLRFSGRILLICFVTLLVWVFKLIIKGRRQKICFFLEHRGELEVTFERSLNRAPNGFIYDARYSNLHSRLKEDGIQYNLKINVNQCNTISLLGLTVSDDLSWKSYTNHSASRQHKALKVPTEQVAFFHHKLFSIFTKLPFVPWWSNVAICG